MKFFISGQIDDAANVRTAMKAVIDAGHSITHDWTKTDTFLGTTQEKLDNAAVAARRGADDLTGVVDCDVYVLMTGNPNPGKGMYVELGAALALNQVNGSPRVYLIGPMNHMSVFYLHPAVIAKHSIEEVLQDVKRKGVK